MHAFVDRAVGFADAHSLLAYALALSLAFTEALPVVGALVPGTAAIIALSALIAAGALNFWPFAASVALGAVFGDTLAYLLGRRYPRTILDRWPLSRHPELVVRGEAFFARHGGKSVLIARFTPGVRNIVPVLAGILGMSSARFFAASLPAAATWAVSHVFFGVALGASLELLGAVAGRLAILAALLVLLAWAVISIARLIARRLPLALDAAVQPLAAWAEENQGWLAVHLRRALATKRSDAFALALMAALLAGGLWLLLGALQELIAGDPLVRLDSVVLHALTALRSHWADHAMRLLAATAAPRVLVVLAAAAAVGLALRRQWVLLLAWLLGLAGAAALGGLLPLLPNAAPPAAAAAPFLFPPSVSALVATTAYGLLTLFAFGGASPRLQPMIASASALLIVFGAAARLYLGLTLLSTEIIASAFALAWIGLTAAIALLQRSSMAQAWPIALIAIPLLIGAVGGEAAGYAVLPLPSPPAPPAPYVMSLAAWQHGGWDTLPGTRVGLLGNYTRPFTLQWAGSPESLARVLLAHGWRRPPSWTLLSAVAWLAPGTDPGDLPVLPHFADGLPQALVLIYLRPPTRLVLRLWPTNEAVRIDQRQLRLWLGALTVERFHRIGATLTVSRARLAPAQDLATLALTLPAARLVTDRDTAPRPRHSDAHAPVLLGWDAAPAGLACASAACPRP